MEFIQAMDYQILTSIVMHLRSEVLTPVFLCITHLGDGGVLWLLTAALCLTRRATRPCGVAILLALVLGLFAGNLVIKNLVARPRPFQTYPELFNLIEQGGYSFPSAHAMSSFASATAVFLFFRRRGQRWPGVVMLTAAALIAFSRLYVCVHYPSDVVCGMLLGIALGCLSTALVRRYYPSSPRNRT